MTATESFRLRDSASWNRRISTLMNEWETARKKTRESAASILMEEGRSVSDVANAFGTTRQWASRLVAETHSDRHGSVSPS